jgi:CBS domain-containing protein
MKIHNVGLIPVGDRHNVVGVVTDRDITVRVTAEMRDPKHTPVGEIMTPGPEFCFEDEDIEEACLRMQDDHRRRLIVLNRQRDMVGVLSLADVAAKTSKERLTGHVLSQIVRTA